VHLIRPSVNCSIPLLRLSIVLSFSLSLSETIRRTCSWNVGYTQIMAQGCPRILTPGGTPDRNITTSASGVRTVTVIIRRPAAATRLATADGRGRIAARRPPQHLLRTVVEVPAALRDRRLELVLLKRRYHGGREKHRDSLLKYSTAPQRSAVQRSVVSNVSTQQNRMSDV